MKKKKAARAYLILDSYDSNPRFYIVRGLESFKNNSMTLTLLHCTDVFKADMNSKKYLVAISVLMTDRSSSGTWVYIPAEKATVRCYSIKAFMLH